MANFDNNGRVLGVILGGIAAGMMGTDEIHAAMARELIERRAADLRAEDKARLAYAREVVRDSMIARHSRHDESCEQALAVLDRLLGGGK